MNSLGFPCGRYGLPIVSQTALLGVEKSQGGDDKRESGNPKNAESLLGVVTCFASVHSEAETVHRATETQSHQWESKCFFDSCSLTGKN